MLHLTMVRAILSKISLQQVVLPLSEVIYQININLSRDYRKSIKAVIAMYIIYCYFGTSNASGPNTTFPNPKI